LQSSEERRRRVFNLKLGKIEIKHLQTRNFMQGFVGENKLGWVSKMEASGVNNGIGTRGCCEAWWVHTNKVRKGQMG